MVLHHYKCIGKMRKRLVIFYSFFCSTVTLQCSAGLFLMRKEDLLPASAGSGGEKSIPGGGKRYDK
jgi:hypothetical protein